MQKSESTGLKPTDDFPVNEIYTAYNNAFVEVWEELKGKFDASEENYRWAIARRMFLVGYRQGISDTLVERSKKDGVKR